MLTRALPSIAVVGALAIVLTGCVGGEQDSTPPPVAVDVLGVPDALVPAEASAEVGYSMVGASKTLPWIVGGSLAEPGTAAVPTVWTSKDGNDWTASPVAEIDGSFSGSVQGSDTRAALGGTVWNTGKYESALWSTVDGEKWESVSLPEEFRGDVRLGSFAVSGDLIFGVGADADGAALGLLVDGGTSSVVTLPKPPKDELLGAQSVILAGKQVVLVATTGPEGDPSPTVSYTSDDLGKTWGDAVEITDSVGFVSGVAAVDDGFVATGATPRGDGANGLAAWFSADGGSWAAESVPAPPQDGALFTLANSDTWLSTPLARGGVVGAVLGNNNAAVSGVYSRQPGGAWSFAAQSSPNSTNGAAGVAMPNDGALVASIIGSGYARMAVVSGGWSDTTVLSAREDVSGVANIYPSDTGAAVTLSRSTFTVDPDLGWRNQNTSSLAELSGDALAEAAWEPEAAASWSGTLLASDETGGELILGSFFDTANRIIPVKGFFRTAADAEWTAVTGFEAGGATSLSGAEKVGETWVAYGTSRATSAAADPEHAAIWTSADGIAWTRESGDFGSGTLESELADVCALPDGDLIGVGWTEVSEGEYRTNVWGVGESGAWSSVGIGSIAKPYGFATSCASDDDGVILGATLGGRDTLQRSTDGENWNEVFRADRGIYVGEPVAVEGGFAASGSVTGADYSGPVVWLSKTGTSWEPVSIPSHDSGSTTTVSPVGDDLVVAMSGRIGDPLTVIRDIKKVISEKG